MMALIYAFMTNVGTIDLVTATGDVTLQFKWEAFVVIALADFFTFCGGYHFCKWLWVNHQGSWK